MTGSTFGLSRIGQIAVNASDLERAVAFYRDVLGMRFLFQVPRMAFFDCGGIRLMLGLAERPEFDHPASVLYYQVAEIAAAHRELASRGVTFEAEPHVVHRAPGQELWLAFLRDSEGNPLALMEERKV
jgi:methylmalonyl-CoA/ethylmalonyl-CoA epimerase